MGFLHRIRHRRDDAGRFRIRRDTPIGGSPSLAAVPDLNPQSRDVPRVVRIRNSEGESAHEQNERMWARLEISFRIEAVQHLRFTLPGEFRETVNDLRRVHDNEWDQYWPGDRPFHFRQGMAIRNSLRQHVCTDDQLPSEHGWDDYYMPALERACNPLWAPSVENRGDAA